MFDPAKDGDLFSGFKHAFREFINAVEWARDSQERDVLSHFHVMEWR